MKINEFKKALSSLETIKFILPSGLAVPAHFHVTEVGEVTKKFIDCGGTVRSEKKAVFQLWEAHDYDHRLSSNKLLKIVSLSEDQLGLGNLEIEVEYQGETIGKYGLDFDGRNFLLRNQKTDCLAPDRCGVPIQKKRIRLSSLGNQCSPQSGCC
jgi:hypothetical protein